MGIINNFLFSDPVTRMTKKHLGFLMRRAEMVSTNIANADTPGYKAKNVEFEGVLERMVNDSNQQASQRMAGMTRTHPKHAVGINSGDGDYQIIEQEGSNLRSDKNTVSLEQEMAKGTKTAMMYDLAITFLKRKGALVSEAMKE